MFDWMNVEFGPMLEREQAYKCGARESSLGAIRYEHVRTC
jgi:hypothetical protein